MLKQRKNMSEKRKSIMVTGLLSFVAFMVSYSYVQEAVFSFWFDQLLGAFWLLSGVTTIYSIIQFMKTGNDEF